ncbi:MAG: hypothetical protein HOP19_08560, partial [Acidobacteria bacterium]|nr:hypothetical protein [Acidobacteriota bacterium]
MLHHTGMRLALLACFLMVGFVPISAQQFNGTLRGTARDSAGAVVPGAEVTITNQNTGITVNTTTNSEGNYIAPQLLPGTYKITVKKAGFKSAALSDVKLDVQQIREADVTLDVGQATETVTVSASGTSAIETTSPTISQTIENKRIVDLPLNGRNPFSLATLSPGVIPGPGSSPFISGGRNATSEVTIDGISNVNAENNVSILDLNYTPSVDAVQEFSVQTNSVSAEFGRLGGGVINLVTKNGTNTFHWTAFEFHRNSALDATNFFTNGAGQRKGSFKRNQFGGNVGGPVFKDKTFFFVNYEGNRQGTASPATFTVPLPEWRRGDFSNLRNANGQPIIIYDPLTTKADPNAAGRFTRDPFPNNIIPTNRINAIARNIMQYWPLPNVAPTNVNTQQNNFFATGTNINRGNQIDSRVDHNFSQNWRTFVRYSMAFKGSSDPFNHYANLATPNNAGPTTSGARSVAVD